MRSDNAAPQRLEARQPQPDLFSGQSPPAPGAELDSDCRNTVGIAMARRRSPGASTRRTKLMIARASFAFGMALTICWPLCLRVIAFYPPFGPLGFAFWASGEIGRTSNSVSNILATGSCA